jgi:hypothetical protein
MRLVEIGGVAFLRVGQMLFDGGRTGKCRRVQPGRHRDDHQRADAMTTKREMRATASRISGRNRIM